jgi:putative inorganic carbon (HCO3(-)) transporter
LALAAVPVLALVSYLAMPFQVRERVRSVTTPRSVMDSNTQRSITRRTGWEMVKAHPWLGLGPEQIKPQFDAYVPADVPRPLPRGWYGHLHNIYLQYAAERGIPALMFLLWMIGKMLVDFARSLGTRPLSPERRYILHGAIAVVCAVMAEGFFEYNLGDSEVLTMFLAVTSCGYVSVRPEDEPCS